MQYYLSFYNEVVPLKLPYSLNLMHSYEQESKQLNGVISFWQIMVPMSVELIRDCAASKNDEVRAPGASLFQMLQRLLQCRKVLDDIKRDQLSDYLLQEGQCRVSCPYLQVYTKLFDNTHRTDTHHNIEVFLQASDIINPLDSCSSACWNVILDLKSLTQLIPDRSWVCL